MGFERSYTGETRKYHRSSGNTILPFWGFNEYEHSTSHERTVYVRDNRYVTGRRAVHGADDYYYDYFERSGNRSPNQKLEDRFVELLFKRYSDILKTPYVCTSVKDFYKKEYHLKEFVNITRISKVLSVLSKIFLIIAIIGIFIGSSLDSENPILLGSITISGVLFFVLKKLKNVVIEKYGYWERKQKNSHGLESLNAKELENVREAYLDSMLKNYGDEMGAILQQVAKGNGYLDI